MTTMRALSDAKRRLLHEMLRGDADFGDRPASERIQPRAPDARIPISVEQRHIWMHAAMAPDVPLYNEAITIHRRGPLDVSALEASFNEILRRHEIWRTAFEIVDGEIEQVVQPTLRLQLPLVDLTPLPPAQREAEALRIATEDARAPLDPGRAPLFRAKLLRLSEDDHRLLLTLHHIIFDGVSIYRVLLPELVATYQAYVNQSQSRPAAPALQYGDYALWRERQVTSDVVERQLDHWRRELSSLPQLQLPIDHPRPVTPTHRGGMATFSLSAALTETLKAFSRHQGVTFYMTLLAAFKTLLFRYSGQEDLVIGGAVDMRRRPELEPLIGYFLNSIALRSRPSADLRFRDYLVQVRDMTLSALAASDVPFDRVVRAVQPRREPDRHPIFQVLFSVEPPAARFPDGWDLTQMDVTVGAAKFDLYLELDERPEGLIGRFLYSAELFEAPTIRRMIAHWTGLLEAVCANPDTTLGRLPMLTAPEARQILTAWNDTHRAVAPITVHGWFEAQARRTPDAVAVTCDDIAWTYRALDHRANQLAARLRVVGLARGTVVGICVERSIDMVAGLLAILKAGGAYLPLDPGFPTARLALILDDAQPTLLLSQRSLLAILPTAQAAIVLCDDVGADDAPDVSFRAGSPEDLAYVLYTSGSTGKPKGVEVPHRAVVNLLASMQRDPGFGAQDVLLAVTTVAFDIAALELFLPLVSGGRVVLASREVAADPARLSALIETSRCTVMQATPVTWRGLLEAGWRGGKSLKILCGGEAVSPALADALLPCGAGLWNLYGPTETTIWSTLHRVTAGSDPVPIGRPIGNTAIYILDRCGNPVPIGVVGELYIGGAGLARGYRNDPARTAERFVTRDAAPGRRLYRTGDLARYRDDGEIECLGRTDDQVKIRGFRVGLEEIEAALACHPDVAAAAVRASPDRSGENALSAYIVTRPGRALDPAALRHCLRQSLPGYMVPARYLQLATLPTTPNGKLDRHALPDPPAEATAEASVAEPNDEMQCALAALWREVLGISHVGPHDDFFDLGGHSLLVARLLRRIEAVFGRRLAMASVFRAPTVAQMAALLRDPPASTERPRIIAHQPHGGLPALFWLSPGPVFRPLAQAMGSDRPFLGVPLDPAELEQLPAPPRLSDIAALLARDIRAAQPRGPYYIGGWCTGGILAYEVASQLIAAGQTVGLLLLLDAVNPVHFCRIGAAELAVSKVKFHLAQIVDLAGWRRWRYAIARGQGALHRILHQWSPACLPPALDEKLERAALDYVPPPYPGDVALFQPIEHPALLDYRPGWAEVVRGEFVAHEVPGEHRTVLDLPHVRDLAACMRASLDRAQGIARPGAAAAE